jgi:serine/threonine protein kinase
MFATFTDADLLAEVERRSLTEHVRHAAVEAQVRANYQLGEVLGEGSSAKVYSATHLLTGEGFAIKWINKGGQMNDTASMRAELTILKQVRVCTAAAPEPPFRCCQPSTIVRRARAVCMRAASCLGLGGLIHAAWLDFRLVSQLHHAHLVNLHEVYESESTLWLVMEKVEGGELLAYLEQRRHLSEACVRDIARQLCSSLHYIHSSGVVHRDMKLENVLRATSEPDACVKVADFGLAAILPAFKKNKFEPNASVKRKASTDLTGADWQRGM